MGVFISALDYTHIGNQYETHSKYWDLVTAANRLTLFREIIAVTCTNCAEKKNKKKLRGQNAGYFNVKAGVTRSYRLKDGKYSNDRFHILEQNARMLPCLVFITPQTSSGHYMYRQFNIQQSYVLPTQCICVFCVDLRTNRDYFSIQH